MPRVGDTQTSDAAESNTAIAPTTVAPCGLGVEPFEWLDASWLDSHGAPDSSGAL